MEWIQWITFCRPFLQKNEVLLLLEEIDHNTFECQVGDTRGRVHKSCMKIITPLSSASQVTCCMNKLTACLCPVGSDVLTFRLLCVAIGSWLGCFGWSWRWAWGAGLAWLHSRWSIQNTSTLRLDNNTRESILKNGLTICMRVLIHGV